MSIATDLSSSREFKLARFLNMRDSLHDDLERVDLSR
jgi:hypothetical protein